MNTGALLKNIRAMAVKFIEENYADELPYFETFWQVFNPELTAIIETRDIESLRITPASQIINEISLIEKNSLNMITPVLLRIIAEIDIRSQEETLPDHTLERLIASCAARQGAKPSLTASLLKNLPKLYSDLAQIDENESATIFEATKQYHIWTEGTERIVESIEQFEKNRTKYLFWIDLDEKNNISPVNPKLKLPQQPVNLLRYLTKHIGFPIPPEDIFREIFSSKEIDTYSGIDNIEQNLSKLHKFCGNKLRQHLFTNHKQGFGLKDSFRNKYFLFERLAN